MAATRWGFARAAALAAALVIAPAVVEAQAPKTVKIRVQSVIPTSADEVTMLKEFAADVAALTNNTVTFEILPAGALVPVNDTLDAVDKGLIEGGFAWTHYWSGKHPAATLFGSPAAGSGLGMDNFAWVSWFLYGGGQQLYDQLWKEMKVNVKGFILQPVGPEALGWFKKPINNMAEVFADPQVRAREMHVELPHPELGTLRTTGVPVKLAATPGGVRVAPPLHGADTDTVLAEGGFGPDEIAALRSAGVI